MYLFIIIMCVFIIILYKKHYKRCKIFEDLDKCIKDINKLIDSIIEDRNKR